MVLVIKHDKAEALHVKLYDKQRPELMCFWWFTVDG